MTCVNCGHGSLVKSNFKLTPSGKAYCVLKCTDAYNEVISHNNANARQKGEKVE